MKPQLIAYKLKGFGPDVTDTTAPQVMEKILSTIIGFLSLIAFIYFIFQIIFAGFAYISAGGDKNKMESAQKQISNGLIGILVVIIAVAFVSLLGRIIGIPNVLNLSNIINNLSL